MSMNLRHAAALTLVGWYLMLPPMNKGSVDPYAPLSEWEVIGSSESASECEEAAEKFRVWAEAQRSSDMVKLDKELKSATTNEDRKAIADRYADRAKSIMTLGSRRVSKKCIASDDPRFQKQLTKSRHAATPLGSYIMDPPLKESGDYLYRDDTVPLGQWGMVGSFDSVDACERRRQFQFDGPYSPHDPEDQKTKCIGTNDPRLNEK